jgi:glycerophosphoryl diester phosphodiesterase
MKWLIAFLLAAVPGGLLAQTPNNCPNFDAQKVMNAARMPKPGISVVGAHRGYWEFVPENSILAVQAAVDMCVEISEVDLRLTLDKVPVLQHDAAIERTTSGSGYIYDLCYDHTQSHPEVLVGFLSFRPEPHRLSPHTGLSSIVFARGFDHPRGSAAH